MSSLPETLSSIQVDLLETAPLKNEEIIELLAFICQAEAIEPYKEHIKVLRNRYDMTLEVSIRTPEIEVLSLREKFNVRSLRNFYVGLEDQGYYSLIAPMATAYQEDKNAAVYAQTLEEVFGVQLDEGFIRDMIDFLENAEMDGIGIVALIRYFRNKLDRVSEYAPIPDYIRDFDIVIRDLPRLQEREISEDLPNDYIADYLITQLDNYAVVEEEETENAKRALIERLEGMSEVERRAFVNLFKVDEEEVKRIREDRDVFRVYGPVNPFTDLDFSILTTDEGEPDVNVIFGGNRMFTDLSLEWDDETDLPLDDWFRGFCMQCSHRIRAYHHAVREPILQGGWRGCYCSWNCVRRSIELITESSPEDNPDLHNIMAMQMALTRVVEEDIIERGIADRDIETPEEDEEGNGIRHQEVDQDAVDQLRRNLPQVTLPEPYVPVVPEDIGEINES